MFDSHSRDVKGLPSSIGTSVLLKFGSIFERQEYIREVHFIEAGNLSQYCHIQHLQATLSSVEVRNFILEALKRKRKRATIVANNAQREQSQKRKQQRDLSEFKKNDRHKNIVYLKSKRKKSPKEVAVTKFKEEIKKGPLYIPENK